MWRCLRTVKSEVLGERLSGEELDVLIDEISKTLGVFLEITRRKALVGAIEERKQVAFLNESTGLTLQPSMIVTYDV